MSSARRLALFAFSLAALALGAELFVRAHAPVFAAATNRALAKSALLDGHGPVDVLFLGTSRMQDGVAPRLFDAELARLGQGEATSFNLAFTSSSLESLEALAARYGPRPGLKLAVVELSVPQLANGPPAWQAPPRATDVEGQLTAWVHAHAQLIAQREALVSDNVVRLPALLWFAPALDGSETRVAEQILAFLGRGAAPAPAFDATSWRPTRYTGDRSTPPSPLAGETGFVAEKDPLPQRGRGQGDLDTLVPRLARLAHAFGSARVVFVVPPYTRRFDDAQERSPRFKRLFAAVAAASGAPIWDFTDLALPDDDFRGLSHLNHPGRAIFSTVLAREVARARLLAPAIAAH